MADRLVLHHAATLEETEDMEVLLEAGADKGVSLLGAPCVSLTIAARRSTAIALRLGWTGLTRPTPPPPVSVLLAILLICHHQSQAIYRAELGPGPERGPELAPASSAEANRPARARTFIENLEQGKKHGAGQRRKELEEEGGESAWRVITTHTPVSDPRAGLPSIPPAAAMPLLPLRHSSLSPTPTSPPPLDSESPAEDQACCMAPRSPSSLPFPQTPVCSSS
eukprot:2535332-Rhodomonas_salina.4